MGGSIDVLSWVMLVGGALFSIIGGIGILRFPDFYTRMHAAGVTDTMGASMVLSGLMLQAGPTLLTAKLAMILFFVLVASPTSAHALAKAALTHGLKPWTPDAEDSPSPN